MGISSLFTVMVRIIIIILIIIIIREGIRRRRIREDSSVIGWQVGGSERDGWTIGWIVIIVINSEWIININNH